MVFPFPIQAVSAVGHSCKCFFFLWLSKCILRLFLCSNSDPLWRWSATTSLKHPERVCLVFHSPPLWNFVYKCHGGTKNIRRSKWEWDKTPGAPGSVNIEGACCGGPVSTLYVGRAYVGGFSWISSVYCVEAVLRCWLKSDKLFVCSVQLSPPPGAVH